MAEANHITVCVCTYKKPFLLMRLLGQLELQQTEGLFNYSVVIADNDYRETAKVVVMDFLNRSALKIVYCVEPEQNIALARNKAIEHAKGNFIAFIDDDEIPEKNWLHSLLVTCISQKVDGVLGPVRPYFEHVPARWILNAKIFNRPEHKTGYKLSWAETRSGNVIINSDILEGIPNPFRSKFGTGSEDVDFFRRMIANGRTFIWCNEAAVNELVPPERCTCGYQIRMALLRGGNSLKHDDKYRSIGILKSFIAIPFYAFMLPLLFITGAKYSMKYLIKIFDHLGKILKIFGINPVNKRG